MIGENFVLIRNCKNLDSFSRAVHKAVCNDLLPKDALTRLARYAMANVCLVTSLKYYARAVVGLDHDPQAGLKYCIVFTYTMINHRPSNARVFQISRVECVPTPETMQSTVPEVQAKVTDRDRLWVQLELKPDTPGIHTSYRTFERVEKWWLDLPDPLLGDPINYLTYVLAELCALFCAEIIEQRLQQVNPRGCRQPIPVEVTRGMNTL